MKNEIEPTQAKIDYHYGLISCRLSTITNDSITVGLVSFIGDTANKIYISKYKLSLLKKILKPHNYRFFKSILKAYQDYSNLDLEKYDWEHKNQNGIIKFQKIHSVIIDTFDDKQLFFDSLFEEYVNKYNI